MTYIRVIPRDLFNEANLLKCLGQLYIKLDMLPDHHAQFGVEDVPRFEIEQDPNDGSIEVTDIPFYVREECCRLFRPLNSREPWPLYCTYRDDVIPVFDDTGILSLEFVRLVTSKRT